MEQYKTGKIEVYDEFGKRLNEHKLNEGDNKVKILNGFHVPGVYYASLIVDNKIVTNQKIVFEK